MPRSLAHPSRPLAAATLVAAALVLALAPARSGASGTPPSVTTGASAAVTATSAHVSGTVNPNGSATSYVFDYGATTGYGAQTAAVSVGAGTGGVAAAATLSGLVADTTYHYRLVATSAAGTVDGADATLTTAPSPPSATTGSASAISGTSAVLSATVNPQGKATTYQFQFGTTSGYGLQSAPASAGAGTGTTTMHTTLTGLTPGTNYHYRVIATNPDGTATGADARFTTAARAPLVTTAATTVVTSTTAVLTGQVNPNGRAAGYAFQYGTSTSYGSQTASAPLPSGTSATHVTARIGGLAPGTAYHYRLTGTNTAGTGVGADASFVTTAAAVPSGAAFPAVSGAAAVAITASGAQLNGVVDPPAAHTTWYFEYGLTSAYGVRTAPQTMTGLGARPINARLAGLAAATTFHFRLVAQSGNTLFVGPDAVFTTKRTVRVAPGALVLAASATRHGRGSTLAIAGALHPPAGVAAGAACDGVVEVAVRRGAAILSLRTVTLAPDCSYAEHLTLAAVRLRGVHRLTVDAHFTGNATLLASPTARVSVRR